MIQEQYVKKKVLNTSLLDKIIEIYRANLKMERKIDKSSVLLGYFNALL